MANWKRFTRLHTWIFRRSGGRLGASLAGIPMVFIDTIGRKSGLVRTVPVACLRREGELIAVASNNGQDKDPDWWLNLKARPEVEVQLGTERYRARAEEVSGADREALWPEIVRANPMQKRHQAHTSRVLPVVRLRLLDRLR